MDAELWETCSDGVAMLRALITGASTAQEQRVAADAFASAHAVVTRARRHAAVDEVACANSVVMSPRLLAYDTVNGELLVTLGADVSTPPVAPPGWSADERAVFATALVEARAAAADAIRTVSPEPPW